AKSGKLLEIALRGEDEHPAVPQEAAGLQVLAGLLLIRLLDEAADAETLCLAGKRLAELDVAVPRLRLRGPDAERRQEALAGDSRRGEHRLAKGCGVADGVVGRQDTRQCGGIVLTPVQFRARG